MQKYNFFPTPHLIVDNYFFSPPLMHLAPLHPIGSHLVAEPTLHPPPLHPSTALSSPTVIGDDTEMVRS